MVIGIVGAEAAGKTALFKAIKDIAREKYVYVDIDKTIPYLLKKGGNCYNQLVEELGDRDILNRFGDIPWDILNKRFIDDLELFHDFMKIVQPYVSAYLSKLITSCPNRLIFMSSTYLLDFDWKDKCDRIVCVDSRDGLRMKRMRNRRCNRAMYEKILARTKSPEYMKEHADIVLTNDDKAIFKKEVKKMMRELLNFKKFVDMGMIPLK